MPGDRNLSGRERQIVGLLADGLTQIEIAKRLGLSPRTINVYVSRAAHKLGGRTMAQVVALALVRRDIAEPVNRSLPKIRDSVRFETAKSRRR